MKPKLIKIESLLAHEELVLDELYALKENIERTGVLECPILVDNKHNIILDGHHRAKSLEELGCRYVPAWLVNYFGDEVGLVSWRKDFSVTKEMVCERALTGKPFPPKTSNHIYGFRGRLYEYRIDDLR